MIINKFRDKESVRTFYEDFSKKLMADYVHGNPRAEAAIRHAVEWIPVDARRILDLGCGIGWSSWEMKRHCPEAEVIGIDLSPKMTEIARSLFHTPKLSYLTHDITSGLAIPGGVFDSIVMLDVYEHIPKELRDGVHRALNKILAVDGQIILTCPSLLHQQFLRDHQPDGLQPVDENVTVDEISKLAQDTGGKVVCFNHASIWHSNDYIHAVVQRKPEFIQANQRKERNGPTLESQRERANRLTSRLQVEVTRKGVVLSARGQRVVCIISPHEKVYSETFVRAHMEQLPARIKVLYGAWFPEIQADGRPLVPRHLDFAIKAMSLFPKIFRSIPDHVPRFALKRFFSNNGVDVVLAEYGPTGVAVMEACQRAGVPFVVHFHGFDAYHKQTLKQYESQYKRMFSAARAIIAVSHDMKQQLLNLGAPQEKVFYNACGVDISLFSGAQPARAEPIAVAVGRFVEKKAPHLTLLAFKEVVEACPDAGLLMIGDGPLWEVCKQLAQALGIDGAVRFLGSRDHVEIAGIMRKALMFVQHSMGAADGDSEGTPVAVLEAGASGLPVVSTRHGGIPDVVIDGQTGLLVDEGDVSAMAGCMIKLIKNSELAARLGSAAREQVASEFSMQKSIDNLMRILEASISPKFSNGH